MKKSVIIALNVIPVMSLRFLEIFFANVFRFSFFAYTDCCGFCCLNNPFYFKQKQDLPSNYEQLYSQSCSPHIHIFTLRITKCNRMDCLYTQIALEQVLLLYLDTKQNTSVCLSKYCCLSFQSSFTVTQVSMLQFI